MIARIARGHAMGGKRRRRRRLLIGLGALASLGCLPWAALRARAPRSASSPARAAPFRRLCRLEDVDLFAPHPWEG